jgi:SAM-dependent methyltransferase
MAPSQKIIYHWLTPFLTKLYKWASRVRPLEMAMDFVMVGVFPNIGIPFLESVRTAGSMEQDWDNRARVNALITATGEADENRAEASAIKALQTRILKGVDVDKMSIVLEIGCGIGNLLKPLSSVVKEAHGVDISGEMIKLAKEGLKHCSNVFLHKTDGRLDMFPDSYFDFVFSSGVFIHFPSKPLVYEYFKEAARVLEPDGIFRFHVDGRSYLKWRSHKGGTLRGVVFKPEEIRENLERYGFQVHEMAGLNSLDMWVTATRDKTELD